MPPFKVVAEFEPMGDQPSAVDQLAEGVRGGDDYQTLMGITGSGKTFTVAHLIEKVQKPTLVISPNKSLAAQLANEFRRFFPENSVEYFVSYYDYYQPEAYVPQTDTYIEKDSSVNDEIERLRHSATAALLTRQDVLIVASVSCIYGLGSPEEYEGRILRVHRGVALDREWAIRRLVDIQYQRNNQSMARGRFRVQGDTLEIHPAYEETIVRIELWGDDVNRITIMDPITGEVVRDVRAPRLLPRRLAVRHRRVARHGPAAARHVRGRHVPQADARGVRLPAPQPTLQPPAAFRGVHRTRPAGGVHERHAEPVRA